MNFADELALYVVILMILLAIMFTVLGRLTNDGIDQIKKRKEKPTNEKEEK